MQPPTRWWCHLRALPGQAVRPVRSDAPLRPPPVAEAVAAPAATPPDAGDSDSSASPLPRRLAAGVIEASGGKGPLLLRSTTRQEQLLNTDVGGSGLEQWLVACTMGCVVSWREDDLYSHVCTFARLCALSGFTNQPQALLLAMRGWHEAAPGAMTRAMPPPSERRAVLEMVWALCVLRRYTFGKWPNGSVLHSCTPNTRA